jgi:hypothetical protein
LKNAMELLGGNISIEAPIEAKPGRLSLFVQQ